MRNIWILTKLQLLSLFGINKIRHQGEGEDKKKGKKSLRVLLVLVITLVYVSITYSMMLADVFGKLGKLSAMPGLMALATSMMILLFSIFETKSVLYGFGDYDMVMSWPVTRFEVAVSRAVNMYAYNFAYGLLLLLPAGVVYAVYAAPPVWYYPAFLLILLAAPCIPTLLGALLGTLVTVATARAKRSSVLNTVAQFLLMIVLLAVIFWLNSGMIGAGEQVVRLSEAAFAYYSPAMWVAKIAAGEALPLLWLLLASLIAAAVMLCLLCAVFTGVHTRLTDLPHGKAYAMREQGRRSSVLALYKSEWKRYMASSLYVTNTAFGYVMLLGAGVASAVVKSESYLSIISDPSFRPVLCALPLAVGAIMAMSATTGSAISMEGRQFWIVRSLPVPARELFLAKVLVSVTLAVPTALIAGSLLGIGLKLEPALWPWVYITPIVSAFFSAVFGLTVNIALPKLDWTNEAEVVKQSAAMAASMFGGLGFVAVLAVAAAVVGRVWITAAGTLALLIAALVIWQRLVKRGETRLYAL